MRKKRIISNIIFSIFLQMTLAISGFILPKLTITFFGSDVNGVIASISQFLVYISLVEAGIGDSAIVAMYKPISQNNYRGINEVLSEASKMYNRAGIFYIVLSIILAFIYPIILNGQISYSFGMTMVLVLMGNGVIDYFLLGKYKVFLIASQKYYIYNIGRMISVLVTLVISIFLIVNNCGIVEVKVLAILLHFCESLIIAIYIKLKNKNLDFKYFRSRLRKKIPQRNNALFHQIAATIVYNTDLVVLLLFLPSNSLKEISVFTTYALVYNIINNLVGSSLISGVDAFFGELFVKKDMDKLQSVFSQFELICFLVIFVLYTTAFSAITPFISCYTVGIKDENYVRFTLGFIFIINGILANVKNPAKTTIISAGHFKQTQNHAIIEALINLFFSVILVKRYGVIGVLIGTMLSNVYRDAMTIWYSNKFLVNGRMHITLKRLIIFCIPTILLMLIETNIFPITLKWKEWVFYASIFFIINFLVFIFIVYIFENKCVKLLIGQIKVYSKKKNEKK